MCIVNVHATHDRLFLIFTIIFYSSQFSFIFTSETKHDILCLTIEKVEDVNMLRHIFMFLLTAVLFVFYIITLDFSKFQFLDVIILFMLLFSFVFNAYVIYAAKKKHK